MAQHTVAVTILDKDYKVVCPEEQAADLRAAADHLDRQMRSIRESGKVIGLERIAVMAALNMSYELLLAGRGSESAPPPPDESEAAGAYRNLNRKLDEALHQLRQMEIS